jgi:hypothetical protein
MDLTGLVLLRRRDVCELGHLSVKKYRTMVECGALRPLRQLGNRKALFPLSEVEKVIEKVEA